MPRNRYLANWRLRDRHWFGALSTKLNINQRSDLLALIAHLPEYVIDWEPGFGAFSIRRIVRHVGNAEQWYVSRLVPPDTLPREWDADEEMPLLPFLEMERRTAVDRWLGG